MKEIRLTQGKFALVDDEDFERTNQFKWFARRHRNTFYAVRSMCSGESKYLHRFLLPEIRSVDHIDGDGLNNQRHNLRLATNAQNLANQRKQSGRSSVFKGVSWHTDTKIWEAYIKHQKKKIHLGCYESEVDAAHVYDYAAKTYFGGFARLNFPE